MAILGLGTDIVEIARIEGVISRSGDRLAKRVLSASEWEQYQAHQQPVRFLAKRYAVKEGWRLTSLKSLTTRWASRGFVCGMKRWRWRSAWALPRCM